jgi:hypothetical protein
MRVIHGEDVLHPPNENKIGADYFDKRNPLQVLQRITKRLQNLGYQVTLTPLPQAA